MTMCSTTSGPGWPAAPAMASTGWTSSAELPSVHAVGAGVAVLNHEAGQGPHARVAAEDAVDDTQVGVPALADHRATGVTAQAALEEADVRILRQVPRERPVLAGA